MELRLAAGFCDTCSSHDNQVLINSEYSNDYDTLSIMCRIIKARVEIKVKAASVMTVSVNFSSRRNVSNCPVTKEKRRPECF